jgi:hypothetical protein
MDRRVSRSVHELRVEHRPPEGGSMKRKLVPFLALAVAVAALVAAGPADRSKTFEVTAETIEGCSCPLFCTCYFGPSANEHMCMFDNVYKFRKGSHYGNVDLSDQVVWMSGDLGGEWHKKPGPGMPLDWAVVTYDKKSNKEQKEAIGKVLNAVWNVKWGKFSTREDSIEWQDDAKTSHAKMASGMGEITLDKAIGPDKKTPTVVKNLQYWFTDSNDGFVLAYSKHHFDGENKISQDHKNGFNVTWTIKGEIQPMKAALK